MAASSGRRMCQWLKTYATVGSRKTGQVVSTTGKYHCWCLLQEDVDLLRSGIWICVGVEETVDVAVLVLLALVVQGLAMCLLD